MSVNFQELRELLSAIANTDITELELKSDEFELTVRKGTVISGTEIVSVPQVTVAPTVPPPNNSSVTPSISSEATVTSNAEKQKWIEITSPMVGTFYRASAPEEPPFVDVGERITSGQTVCIIEAMKLMNELEAEVSGQIVEILVQNGEAVEFGQVLMRVAPG
ncbi:MAG: acetyl-CoA carboxylase biotin carboxyl carrier protein [Xenococcaceae cyanobacterium MO_207.B15]|nr:acetyl-CoA carboxylase biotin carboxyl carrier protein [Xenococcaceae cyanobacterium MO_207.B15]